VQKIMYKQFSLSDAEMSSQLESHSGFCVFTYYILSRFQHVHVPSYTTKSFMITVYTFTRVTTLV